MKMMIRTAVFAGLLSLTACGGGGGGSSSASTTPAPQSSSPDSPAPQSAPQSTKDLQVSARFDMQSTWTMDVLVALDLPEEGYLSICTDYTPRGGDYEIDFDSCLLRTALQDGEFRGKLTMNGATERLIGVLYFLDEARGPKHKEFVIEPLQSAITWR